MAVSRKVRICALLMAAVWLAFGATVRPSAAADLGVTGTKLVLLDKQVTATKAKAVFVSKNDPGIQKGPAGDPSLLEGEFAWFYETEDANSVAGCFTNIHDQFGAAWLKNTETIAKFVNPDFDTFFPTSVKVVVVKPGKLAKLVSPVSHGIGGGVGSLLDGPPSAADGVTTILRIDNGNDASTHRMCTRFATDLGSKVIYKEIAGGTGRKLVGKNGVPVACPPSPCP